MDPGQAQLAGHTPGAAAMWALAAPAASSLAGAPAVLGGAAFDPSLVVAAGRGERAREQHRRPGEDPRANRPCRHKGHPKEVRPGKMQPWFPRPSSGGQTQGRKEGSRLVSNPRLAVVSAASEVHVLFDGTRGGDPCIQL
jgi:hypothetical protein